MNYKELIVSIYNTEGLLRGFYKGISLNMFKAPLASATAWTVKNNLNRRMDKNYDLWYLFFIDQFTSILVCFWEPEAGFEMVRNKKIQIIQQFIFTMIAVILSHPFPFVSIMFLETRRLSNPLMLSSGLRPISKSEWIISNRPALLWSKNSHIPSHPWTINAFPFGFYVSKISGKHVISCYLELSF